MPHYERELEVAINAVREAGEAIMRLFRSASVRTKTDGSPVTEADEASDRIIRAHLAEAFPEDAVLTEEGADDEGRLRSRRCWIADPIDGTAAFVAHENDFD